MDRKRLLQVNRSYVEFDENDRVESVPTRFENEDIVGIRYGIKPINGYFFRIGRIYCIDIRHDSNKIMRIRMKTIYKIRWKQLEAKYIKIVELCLKTFIMISSSTILIYSAAICLLRFLELDLEKGVLFLSPTIL